MPTLLETTLTVDHGLGTVSLGLPPLSPEWWIKEVFVDHATQTVTVATKASTATFRCDSGLYNYTFISSQGIDESSGVADLSPERIGQRIFFTPILPSSNDHQFPLRLASYTEPGAPRNLRIGNVSIINPFGVEYAEFTLSEETSPGVWEDTAPRVDGVYTVTVSFYRF